VLFHLSYSARVGYFWGKVLWGICLGWPWTLILLISAFWVVRIRDVSH
jgi:hypothetical protein